MPDEKQVYDCLICKGEQTVTQSSKGEDFGDIEVGPNEATVKLGDLFYDTGPKKDFWPFVCDECKTVYFRAEDKAVNKKALGGTNITCPLCKTEKLEKVENVDYAEIMVWVEEKKKKHHKDVGDIIADEAYWCENCKYLIIRETGADDTG